MADTLTHTGDLTDDLLYGALSPDGSTLYAFELNRGFDIRSYAFPALTGGSVILNDVTGPMACDGDGVLYWVDDALNEAETLAATQIWKNAGSPTLVWSSAFAIPNPTVTLCWSPYDGLLYALIDGLLYSIDPTSGADTLLYTPSVGTPTIASGPVPTLDGGIWWSFSPSSSSHKVIRYDIPGSSGAEAIVGITHYQDQLLPRADGTAVGFTSSGSSAFVVASDLSATSAPDLAGIVGGARGVAYTPDLSLVVFGSRGTNGVWQIGEVVVPTYHFTIGRVGFHG